MCQRGWTLPIQQTPPGSASAPPGNNFTCMFSSPPWLSILHSGVVSSCTRCHSDATSFPCCVISVSSHHSHSHPAVEDSPRCGVLVALPVAQGWNSPWHFALRPVAETPTNHLSLSSVPPALIAMDTLKKTNNLTSLFNPCAQVASPPCQTFFFFFTPATRSNPPTFPRLQAPPGEGAATFVLAALWVMWS